MSGTIIVAVAPGFFLLSIIDYLTIRPVAWTVEEPVDGGEDLRL